MWNFCLVESKCKIPVFSPQTSIFFKKQLFLLYNFFNLSLYSSTTLAVAVTLPGSSETASSSARLFASASGLPPQPEGQLERAAAAWSNEERAPLPAPPSSVLVPKLLPLRLMAGRRFPPRKARWPPVAMDAGGPQWESTTREREEEEEDASPPLSSSSLAEEKEPSRHAGGETSRTTEGPTHTTACGGLDSTAQRPPSATSSNDGAEQTGSRRREGEEEELGLLPSAPPPGKRVAAEHTGLAFAVADAVAAELDPPEVVEAAAAAVEATAALSAARASDLRDEEEGDRRAAKNGFLAPAGRKGLPPPTPPLKRGSSQSSRFVATSACFLVVWKRENEKRNE